MATVCPCFVFENIVFKISWSRLTKNFPFVHQWYNTSNNGYSYYQEFIIFLLIHTNTEDHECHHIGCQGEYRGEWRPLRIQHFTSLAITVLKLNQKFTYFIRTFSSQPIVCGNPEEYKVPYCIITRCRGARCRRGRKVRGKV